MSFGGTQPNNCSRGNTPVRWWRWNSGRIDRRTWEGIHNQVSGVLAEVFGACAYATAVINITVELSKLIIFKRAGSGGFFSELNRISLDPLSFTEKGVLWYTSKCFKFSKNTASSCVIPGVFFIKKKLYFITFCCQLCGLLQLHDPKVRKMEELLKVTKSSYFSAFKSMEDDVSAGQLMMS